MDPCTCSCRAVLAACAGGWSSPASAKGAKRSKRLMIFIVCLIDSLSAKRNGPTQSARSLARSRTLVSMPGSQPAPAHLFATVHGHILRPDARRRNQPESDFVVGDLEWLVG